MTEEVKQETKVPETFDLTITSKSHRKCISTKHERNHDTSIPSGYEEAQTRMKVVKVFSMPNSKCSKCGGRGWKHFNVSTGNYKLCKCVLRVK